VLIEVLKTDPRAVALADRHYSRQTPGAAQFMPPGRTLVLLADRCVWGVCENRDPAGAKRCRVTIFRNEGSRLSSELVTAATRATLAWMTPGLVLETEVDRTRVRAKADPGYCFLCAGWLPVATCARNSRAVRRARRLLTLQPGPVYA
jgi:hypothetical protein